MAEAATSTPQSTSRRSGTYRGPGEEDSKTHITESRLEAAEHVIECLTAVSKATMKEAEQYTKTAAKVTAQLRDAASHEASPALQTVLSALATCSSNVSENGHGLLVQRQKATALKLLQEYKKQGTQPMKVCDVIDFVCYLWAIQHPQRLLHCLLPLAPRRLSSKIV